jgi:hypothetical protein
MNSVVRIPFQLARDIDPADYFVAVSGKNLGGINQGGNPHGLQYPTPPVSGVLVNDRALRYLLFSGFVFPARNSFFFGCSVMDKGKGDANATE